MSTDAITMELVNQGVPWDTVMMLALCLGAIVRVVGVEKTDEWIMRFLAELSTIEPSMKTTKGSA